MSENANKQITVVMAGTGEYKDIAIEPGTTASDILGAIGHPGYKLSKGQGAPFASYDNVFERVNDGEKIFAAAHAEAGRS